MTARHYLSDPVLFVVPIGGKYGRFICPCGRSGLWKLSAGSGWCDCGATLNASAYQRPAFGAGPAGPVWIRAYLDTLPDMERET